MMVFMVIIWVLLVTSLIVVAGVEPRRARISNFELRRREAAGDQSAKVLLAREALAGDILSLQRASAALLLVALTTQCIAAFGWLVGVVVVIMVAIGHQKVANTPIFKRQSQRLYERNENRILRFIEKHPGLFRLLGSIKTRSTHQPRLDSRQELEYVVKNADGILTPDEKKQLINGLKMREYTVKEVMTPRRGIVCIAKDELLGPLVLDDLYKTGHSRFPVIDGDKDHIIGMLHVHNLLALEKKRSLTAEKAMESRVFYVREDHDLQQALTGFLRTRQHLFIVINESHETVGLISLEDVVEKLLGRKLYEEFDAHDNLHLVATHNPHS